MHSYLIDHNSPFRYNVKDKTESGNVLKIKIGMITGIPLQRKAVCLEDGFRFGLRLHETEFGHFSIERMLQRGKITEREFQNRAVMVRQADGEVNKGFFSLGIFGIFGIFGILVILGSRRFGFFVQLGKGECEDGWHVGSQGSIGPGYVICGDQGVALGGIPAQEEGTGVAVPPA